MTSLRYPQGIGSGDADYVIFTPMKYRTNKADQYGGGGGEASAPSEDEAQSIVFYMPNSTPAMGNQNDWNKAEFGGPLGELRRDASSAMGDTMINFMSGAGGADLVQDITSKFQGGIDNITSKFKGAGAQLAMQGVGGLLGTTPNQMMALARGQVFNPNVELLYNAPQMRPFNMAFDMIPKNAAEANNINQIKLNINKRNSPKDLENGMFEVPYVWQVKYMSGKKENQNMNKFKRAACTNVQVQANQPTPMHVAHLEGVPAITSIALSFVEVDIITRQDHEKVGGQGY